MKDKVVNHTQSSLFRNGNNGDDLGDLIDAGLNLPYLGMETANGRIKVRLKSCSIFLI